jgi:hypothetical protein
MFSVLCDPVKFVYVLALSCSCFPGGPLAGSPLRASPAFPQTHTLVLP